MDLRYTKLKSNKKNVVAHTEKGKTGGGAGF